MNDVCNCEYILPLVCPGCTLHNHSFPDIDCTYVEHKTINNNHNKENQWFVSGYCTTPLSLMRDLTTDEELTDADFEPEIDADIKLNNRINLDVDTFLQ